MECNRGHVADQFFFFYDWYCQPGFVIPTVIRLVFLSATLEDIHEEFLW